GRLVLAPDLPTDVDDVTVTLEASGGAVPVRYLVDLPAGASPRVDGAPWTPAGRGVAVTLADLDATGTSLTVHLPARG
ncbi:MAG TPA: hypothetical protein VHO26_03295, partial [Propionibacteriaceae bacterium]|nr:hypothetical protein [Propionibacteriaceae bacterium]